MFLSLTFVLFFNDSFIGMGAWRKTINPQKLGNFPRYRPEVVYKKGVAKERAAQKESGAG